MKKHFFVALLIIPSAMALAQVSPGQASRQFQYLNGVLSSTSSVVSSVPAWNSVNPPKWFTFAASTTDTGFQIALEGSLDNVNWSEIAITNTTSGSISNKNPQPFLYLRARALVIGAGTNVTATAIGVW